MVVEKTASVDAEHQQEAALKPIHITHGYSRDKRCPASNQLSPSGYKSFDSDQVEEVLLATIATNEEPPPTMKEVAERLGGLQA